MISYRTRLINGYEKFFVCVYDCALSCSETRCEIFEDFSFFSILHSMWGTETPFGMWLSSFVPSPPQNTTAMWPRELFEDGVRMSRRSLRQRKDMCSQVSMSLWSWRWNHCCMFINQLTIRWSPFCTLFGKTENLSVFPKSRIRISNLSLNVFWIWYHDYTHYFYSIMNTPSLPFTVQFHTLEYESQFTKRWTTRIYQT